ncbi:hypothetical protein [Streptomyces lincolnensis]|uniref:hypothetical protein n=1 Tax=Streptomyces lincolnensis TaxID=1915 RepID=UPI0037D20B36
MSAASEGIQNMSITTFRSTDSAEQIAATPFETLFNGNANLTDPTVQAARANTPVATALTAAPADPFAGLDDDTVLTYRAAALYLARETYAEALKQDDPAAALDDICDALPEVMPQVFQEKATDPALAKALLPELADRMWAFTAVEYARTQAADYEVGYLFDLFADALKNGADPKTIRTEALAMPKRLRDARVLSWIQESREETDGPWAEILDIFLGEIENGADPQAVVDRGLTLLRQASTERAAAKA